MMKKMFLGALVAVAAASAWAQADVKVENAWVRGTVAQQKATGAFMRLTAAAPARLVEARSPVAGVVEIHEMAMDKDVMRMRPIPGLDLAAGRTTELKPGGYHVMLMDLKQQMKPGENVPLTLVFEDSAKKRFTQELQVPVMAVGASAPAAGGMGHGSGHGAHKH